MSFRIAPITVQEEHSILTGLQIINTIRQRIYGKLMFSVLSVCLLTRGVSCDHYPWYFGSHWASSLHGTSLYRVHPAMGLPLSDTGPRCTGSPTSDIWWPSLETCSTHSLTSAVIWWLLKYILPSIMVVYEKSSVRIFCPKHD